VALMLRPAAEEDPAFGVDIEFEFVLWLKLLELKVGRQDLGSASASHSDGSSSEELGFSDELELERANEWGRIKEELRPVSDVAADVGFVEVGMTTTIAVDSPPDGAIANADAPSSFTFHYLFAQATGGSEPDPCDVLLAIDAAFALTVACAREGSEDTPNDRTHRRVPIARVQEEIERGAEVVHGAGAFVAGLSDRAISKSSSRSM
jgi:hypothetical protein